MPRAAKVLCVQCDTERAWQRRICPKCGKTKTKPVPVVVVDASPDDSCNEDDRALDLVAETSEAAAAESEEDSEEDSEVESEEEGEADPQDEKEQKKLRKKARNDADKQRPGRLAALQPPQSTLPNAVGPRIFAVRGPVGGPVHPLVLYDLRGCQGPHRQLRNLKGQSPVHQALQPAHLLRGLSWRLPAFFYRFLRRSSSACISASQSPCRTHPPNCQAWALPRKLSPGSRSRGPWRP